MAKFSFKGGINIYGAKKKKVLTTKSSVTPYLSPKKVHLPLGQNLGKPPVSIVRVGDIVKQGQKIAQGDGMFSVNLHASISGKVIEIKNLPEPRGFFSPTIVIENNFENEIEEKNTLTYKELAQLTKEDIIGKIIEAGIVGLGGAAFPTHVKYFGAKPCNSILLNGIECEPYNTADYITIKKHQTQVIKGLFYLLKAAGAKKGVICIEDNKIDVYRSLKKEAKNYNQIEVVLFKEKYPQGAERQLIYAYSKKQVPYGGLPIDIGFIVNNVGTAKAVCDAIEDSLPLTHHYVTVTGDGLKNPQSFYVPIGTLFSELIEACGGAENSDVILAGGLMMGKSMINDEIPITKGINAIITLKDLPKKNREEQCIRCSKCVDKCPAFLEPTTLATLVKYGRIDELEKNGLNACIECGTCSYVCPSHIPILDYIRQGKIEVRRDVK